MAYNNVMLKEKILSEFDTFNDFAEVLGVSSSTLGKKLNGKSSFLHHEIQAAASLLHLESPAELEMYFFTKLSENKRFAKNLFREMLSRRISPSDMSKQLNITTKTLFNKISGNSDFTWREVCCIQSTYFPEISKDELFERGCII